ncbi:hypothetical protein PhCBS80983_g04890 [Powellomyces hirtus]|uniref:Protein PNS1 n=1 Tax=Powellomyces hirtus TaxID=109895 RepID=A0A507DWT8_9FUNG|nr:hypothetical protein PhCBS80983_g04890 [Powellomyces hirtus]
MPPHPKGAGYIPLTAPLSPYTPAAPAIRSPASSVSSQDNEHPLLALHSSPHHRGYRPQPAPSPYAEPPLDNLDNDNHDGAVASNSDSANSVSQHPNPLLEKLLSNTSLYDDASATPDAVLTHFDDRTYNDLPVAILYILCFAALLVTGAVMWATTTPGPAETILPRSVYKTIKDSAALLTATTIGAVALCCLWLSMLRSFVRPVVLVTIYTIPMTCLAMFSVMVTNSVLGKVNDAPYLGIQYDGMIVGASAFLLSGLASVIYLYRKRKETEQTVHILQLSCDILRTNPGIFIVSIGLTTAYTLFAFTWVLLFSRLFLRGWKDTDPSGIAHWHFAGGTGWAVTFFVLMYFWTSAIFKNVEKVTIAGVVGEWYFQRPEDSVSADRTWKYFVAAATTSFGSICLGSLILGVIQTLQFASRAARRVSGTHTPLHRLLTSCLDCGGHLADNVTSYALVYVGLTGSSFTRASYSTTRVFRRNLILGLVTTTVTRLILFVTTTTLAMAAGITSFFFASRALASPYAYVVGVVGAVVPYYLVQVLAHVVQNTVDATFICYLLDIDANTVNCDTAHRIFGTLVT